LKAGLTKRVRHMKPRNQIIQQTSDSIVMLTLNNDDIGFLEHLERIFTGAIFTLLKKIWLYFVIHFLSGVMGGVKKSILNKYKNTCFEYQFYKKRTPENYYAIKKLISLGISPREIRRLALGYLLGPKGEIRKPRTIDRIFYYLGLLLVFVGIVGFVDMSYRLLMLDIAFATRIIAIGMFGAWLGALTYTLAAMGILPVYTTEKLQTS